MPPPGVCLNIMEARYNESIAQPARLFNQDYQQLKQHCLQKRERYRDDMFPPDRRSIGEGLLEPSKLACVEWKRPAEIAPNPSFVLDGASRFDFGQGELGDCWFLASIGALTCQRHFLEWVVRLEQTFDKDYCGLFHFRFWRFGKWVDVVIDDKLPTIYGKLIFVHSKNRNEFWPALLEKAYAKVCGSYSDLSGGSLSEAMMDFTGGVHMCIQLSQPPSNLWDLMNRAGKYHTLMGCGTHHTPQGKTYANNELPNGLVSGHAYTVTGVKQILSQRQVVNLVRLWNPWGHGEWKGDWSDRSSRWQTVSAQDRAQCLEVRNNGEFWMNLEDFCKSYVVLDICCSSPDFLDSNSPWETSIYEGKWIAGISAGGCIQNKDSFCTNPQYRVKIDGQYSEKHGDYNILVSLMQKPDKRNRHKVHLRNIGFCVFKYEAHRGMLPSSFFNTHAPLAKTYNKTREVMMFLLLTPGEYLIVPSTEMPNETASFILFIHSKAETHVSERSYDHKYESVQKLQIRNPQNDGPKQSIFLQYSDKYEEVDAEQLQRLLNKILKEDLKSGHFTIDACRSMVALMDTSITGKLNSGEFFHLWKKIDMYKNIFFHIDVHRTGTVSLSDLRNAFIALERRVSDGMLNLMAVRYGASSGHITLENFISLILRLDCMYKIFKQLSDGKTMNLRESEWMYISMYT